MATLPDQGSYAVARRARRSSVMGVGFGLAMPQVTTLAMDAGPAAGRRSRLRVRQHHPAGRWRAGPGRGRDGRGGQGRAPGSSSRRALAVGGLVATYLAGTTRARRRPAAGPVPVRAGRQPLPWNGAEPSTGRRTTRSSRTPSGTTPTRRAASSPGPRAATAPSGSSRWSTPPGSPTFYEFDSTDLLPALQGDGRPRRGAGGRLPLAHRDRGLPEPHRHRPREEPNAHYVLVSTREHGNNDGPVEFRSYRIVDGEVTEEEVDVVEHLRS